MTAKAEHKHDMGDLYNPNKMHDPICSIEEKYKLVPAFLQTRGLFRQHIDSFNHFVDVEMQRIIMAKVNNKIVSDVDEDFYLKYRNIRVGMPEITQNFKTEKVTPHECRMGDLTYCADIFVDIEYFTNQKTIRKNAVKIGSLPIMLGSNHCYLKDKTPKELALIKECPYDPKGYFIIKGTEKVVLMQEQMSKNRILVERDSKTGALVANCASNTLETKSRISLLVKNHKVYLKSNSFTELIPVMVIFKAMGYIQDQEIVQMIGTEKHILEELFLSFQEAVKHRIHTQEDALKYLGERIKNPFKEERPVQKSVVDDARNVLANILLAHIKCRKFDFYPKFIYLGLMVRRLMQVQGSPDLCDDKDYIGNKRTEAAGEMLALLFEDLFKKFNTELKREIDLTLKKGKDIDVSVMMNSSSITHGLISSLASGNWTIKRFKVEKKGVTQILNRLSYVAAVGMMTRLESHIEKSRKVSGLFRCSFLRVECVSACNSVRPLDPEHSSLLIPSNTHTRREGAFKL